MAAPLLRAPLWRHGVRHMYHGKLRVGASKRVILNSLTPAPPSHSWLELPKGRFLPGLPAVGSVRWSSSSASKRRRRRTTMTRGEGEERGGDGACCHGRGTDGVDVAAAAASWASTTRLMQPVAAMCHGFEVRAEDVEVLDTPASFYDTLVREARAASRRVVLGSLYVGTGDREATLVSVIADRLRSVPELGVRVMVDHSRGLRRVRGAVEGGQTSGSGGGGVGGGGGGGDVAAEARSSQHVLAPLLEACNAAPDHGTSHHERVQVGYLQMPQLQGKSKAKLPARYKEGIAVSHIKAYVFDDTVILSGANLSNDYFTNRQDRYVVFRNAPGLSDYFASLVTSLVDTVCWRQDTAQPLAPPSPPPTMDAGTLHIPPGVWRDVLAPFLLPPHTPATAATATPPPFPFLSCSTKIADGDASLASLREQAIDRLGTAASTTASTTGTTSSSAHDTADTGSGSDTAPGAASGASPAAVPGSSSTTLVFPSLQLAAAGVHQDEEVTKHLLAGFASAHRLHLASGYFNLPATYKDTLVHNPDLAAAAVEADAEAAAALDGGDEVEAMAHILTAAPQANGFWTAQKIASALPLAYSQLEKTFYWQCQRAGLGDVIKLHEYHRAGWTFHGKGLWLTPLLQPQPQQEQQQHQQQQQPQQQQQRLASANNSALSSPLHPSVVMVGSPNFGRRSVDRDLEAQVTLVTNDPGLRAAFGEERDQLFEGSTVVDEELWKQSQRQLVGWGWKAGRWIHVGHRVVAPFL